MKCDAWTKFWLCQIGMYVRFIFLSLITISDVEADKVDDDGDDVWG